MFFFLAAFVLIMAWTYTAIAHSGNTVAVITGRTGAPDDGGTCYDSDWGCHNDFDEGSGTGDVYVTFDKAVYEADDEIEVTVTVDSGAAGLWTRFGFQIVVLDVDDNFVGAWNASTNPSVDVEENNTFNPSRYYVYHKPTAIDGTDSRSWSFNWTSDELKGDVTFYVTGIMSVDGSGDDGYAYSNSSVLEQVNQAPTLTNPDVSPPEDGQDFMFRYSVLYEDPDEDPVEDYVRLIINDDEANPIQMAESGTIAGEWYVEVKGINITVGDDHVYRFMANDSEGAPATGEGTINSSGPVVNDPPVLTGGGLDRPVGGEGDDYTFNVTLTDINVGQAVVVNVTIAGTSYAMSSADTDYTDGAEFNVTLPGSTIRWGNRAYLYEATDELGGFGDLDDGDYVYINDDPVLSDGAVNRTSGGEGDTFTFNVTYTDINAGQTATVRVNFTGGGSYVMSNGGDSDYTDGAVFSVSLTGATIGWGVKPFVFEAVDQMTASDTRDLGLSVTVNDDPVLSSGGVDQATGGEGDTFNFTVTYTDINAGQTAEVYLRIVGVGTFPMGTLDVDYTDGAVFATSVTGATIGSGVYNYTFWARDEMNAMDTLDPGAQVTVNDDPELSNGGVDRATGTEADSFTFNVTYTDINAGQSATVSVRIVGSGTYAMNDGGDADYTDGANFVVTLTGATIGPGVHAFTFLCVDNMSATDTLDPTLTVTINDAPVLSNGVVDRASGTEADTFVFNVTYTDINTGQTATVTLNITGVGTFAMASLDVDYTDGAVFGVALTGGQIGFGVHAFTYEAEDNMSATATLDPSLTVTVNDPPALSGGAVDKAQGVVGETFNFTVTYTDVNAGQVPTVWLIIVGNATNFTMSATDPSDTDYSDGNEFYIEVQVDLGDHSFYFAASDGLQNTRDPGGAAVHDGPEVGASLAELHVSSLKFYREDGTEVGGATGKAAVKWEDTDNALVVVNTGGLTANTYRVVITLNDGEIYNASGTALAPGAFLNIDWVQNYTVVGLNYVNVTVDILNTTSETDETNNTHAAILTVKDFVTALPYTITGQVIYPNGTVVPGAYVNFTNLRNTGTASLQTDAGGNYTYVLNDGANLTYNEGDRFQIIAEAMVDGTLYNKTVTIRVYSEDALAWVNFTVGRKAGINLVNVSADSLNSLPGVIVTFTVNLTNTGNFYDTFNLTNTSLQGWFVEVLNGTVPSDTISLGEGDWVILTVRVTIPAGVAAGTLETVNLTVTSQFDPATMSSILLNITILQYAGVDVVAPPGNLTLPGLEIYDFNVTNTGNGADTYDLAVTTGWVYVMKVNDAVATTISLASGETGVVTIELTVPIVRNGTTDLLTLTATSQFNAGVSDADSLTTTVDRFAGVIVTVQAPVTQTNLTGTLVTYTFNVTNTGNEDDVYDLSVVADARWGANVQATVAVAYGATETVSVTVTVPDLRNGTSTTVDLTAISQFDGGVSDTDTGNSIVDRYAGVTVTALAPLAQTGLQGTTLTYTFNVTNTGNEDDVYDLTAVSDLAWTTDVNLTVAVAYQDTEVVTVTVTVPDVQNGTTSEVELTATSQFDAGESDADDVDATVALYAGGTLDQPADDSDQPGQVITYTFTVDNTGNEDDRYTITVTSPGGWDLNYPATIDVDYQDSDTFDVDVTVRELPAGMEDELRVTITSGNDNGETYTETVTSTVLQIARVTIIEPMGFFASPDDTIEYEFTVINNGNDNDAFDLDYTIPGGWTHNNPTTVTTLLAPGGVDKITVNLTLPDVTGAAAEDVVSTFMSATSQFNAAKFATGTVDTTILQVYDLSLADDGAMPAQMLVGQAYPVELTLENLGNGDDTLNLLLTDAGAAWASLDDDTIDLASQAQGTVTLTVTIPDSTRATESGRQLIVKAYSGQTSQALIYSLNINPASYGLAMSLDGGFPDPIEVGVEQDLTLNVDNTGSFDDTVTIQLSGSGAGWATLSEYSTLVAAGGTETVDLTVLIPVNTPISESGKLLTVSIFTPHASDEMDHTINIDPASYGLTLSDDGELDDPLVVGDTYRAELTVDNTGSFTETVYFKLSGEGAIYGTLDSYSEDIPAGDSATVTLTVTIPDLTPMDGARAAKDLVVDVFTQHASQQLTFPIDIDMNSYGFISFFLEDEVDQNPGDTSDYSLLINHAGSSPSRYSLSVITPPDGWTVTLAQSLVDISSGSRTISVDVTIPADFTSDDPDDLETIMVVVDDLMSPQTEYVTLEVTVNQYPDVTNMSIKGYAGISATVENDFWIEAIVGPLDAPNLSVDWDMGDGTLLTDRGVSIKHTYAKWGNYTITATVTNTVTTLESILLSPAFELVNTAPDKLTFPNLVGAEAKGSKFVADEGDVISMRFDLATLRALDPDGELIFLFINWGDGTLDYLPIEPADTGSIEASHTYTVDVEDSQDFEIQAYVIDNTGINGQSNTQKVEIREVHSTLDITDSLLNLFMIFLILIVGVLLVAATHHRRREPSASSATAPPGYVPAPAPATSAEGAPPVFIPGGPVELSEEERARIERLEQRMDRMRDKEELLEVASYDASRVTTMLEEHLRKFDEIIIRAQELAAKDRLEQLQKELEEADEKQMEEELAES